MSSSHQSSSARSTTPSQSSAYTRAQYTHDDHDHDAPPAFGSSYGEVNNETDELGTEASVAGMLASPASVYVEMSS